MQKAGRKRTHPKRPTHHAKSLHGRPRVSVQLGRSHIKCPKDTDRERIKRKGHMEVRKKIAIHEKKGVRWMTAPYTRDPPGSKDQMPTKTPRWKPSKLGRCSKTRLLRRPYETRTQPRIPWDQPRQVSHEDAVTYVRPTGQTHYQRHHS